MKLALGTAQFGMPYGIANETGAPSLDDVRNILEVAATKGINFLDTAYSYGDAESKLGKLNLSSFNIISKMPIIPLQCGDIYGAMRNFLETSLIRLGQNSIYGLLLHRPSQLEGFDRIKIINSLQKFKEYGLIRRWGISIYSPNELSKLSDVCDFDIVQAPLNVFDQRLVQSGWLDKLASKNVEIHTRSVFLQGLLLLPRERLPENFKKWIYSFRNWYDWQESNNMSAYQACLAFVQSFEKIDRVIIGVDSLEQLNMITSAVLSFKSKTQPESFKKLSCSDEGLINPSNWV